MDSPAEAKDQARSAVAAGEAPPAAAAEGKASGAPLYSTPQARVGWTPYAPGASVRSSAVLSPQPDLGSALVWLGSGLVGVAGAAGVVWFRLRNP
ncbi:hypothetical protein [Pseudarthrobacter sp. NS4]|uniref:hypothetical protein n=1 Tax=Pseudarthrobacter sp. NS4 TaxID=2973976 RepID=UPI002163DCAF|nr:hypothetical protein [Pseudarthrobacter sp. NS4]